MRFVAGRGAVAKLLLAEALWRSCCRQGTVGTEDCWQGRCSEEPSGRCCWPGVPWRRGWRHCGREPSGRRCRSGAPLRRRCCRPGAPWKRVGSGHGNKRQQGKQPAGREHHREAGKERARAEGKEIAPAASRERATPCCKRTKKRAAKPTLLSPL